MARVSVQVPVDEPPEDQPATQQQPPEPPTSPEPAGVSPKTKTTQSLLTRRNLIVVGVAIAIIVVIFLLFSLMNQKKDLEKKVDKLSSGQNSQNDTQKYQEDVSKIVHVPSGITPVVSTPDDAKISQLSKDNSLYKDAKSGDVFLLYTNPDKSLYLVIYRPSAGKVILALSQVSQQEVPTNTRQP